MTPKPSSKVSVCVVNAMISSSKANISQYANHLSHYSLGTFRPSDLSVLDNTDQ